MPTYLKTDGHKISVTSAAPTDSTLAADFAALTWTDATACEIKNFSGWSDDWDMVEDDTFCLDNSAPQKSKRRLGEVTFELKTDLDNTAFHTIMDTAEGNQNDIVSVRIQDPDGTRNVYFTAQVKQYNDVYGGTATDVTKQAVFQPQTKRVKDF